VNLRAFLFSDSANFSTTGKASLPEILITAMAPTPVEDVARAQIVSVEH
jgi:hypothetical protein